ncbi:MAG TPA: PhzF family phenazine biosynthesis protein [Blastocatellia bacterium]|nr:PhzF family phenazine biosynthesis protein [Blastocatellia bacterium]
MKPYKFALVDVFTEQPLAGNQLAVFPNAQGLTEDQMQAIAREFNYSETTFILPPRHAKADFRLRSFSPSAEVFGAGHNALGAWWVLGAQGAVSLSDSGATLRQELGERVLPVEISSRAGSLLRVAMTQGEPRYGKKLTGRAALAGALGLDPSELESEVESLDPQAVSTGARHLLVPVRSLAALKRVRVDAEKLIALASPLGCHGCYLFSLETLEPGSAAHARAFFPGIGISEDPATGSAAGPLAALLASRGLIPEDAWVVIEQGDQMARPSRIEARVRGDRIEVAGRSVIVAEGTLFL